MTPPLTDLALSRRLEGAEGAANAASVDARALLRPGTGATWARVRGTLAMFDGAGSFLTQSFGFGTCGEASAAALDELEAFFRDRGAEPMHEVSPIADPAVLGLFASRGYRVVELTSILWQPVDAPMARGGLASGGDARGDAGDDAGDQAGGGTRRAPRGATQVRIVRGGDIARWADTAARGWGDQPGAAEFVRDFAPVAGAAAGTHCFLAEVDGEPAGAGTLAMHDGVAILAGASTVPAFRGRGVQKALLQARLAQAAAHGCDLAAMGALPGSASQRNAERQGFRIAYTRLKWHLPADVGTAG
jgi:GNAT superfamily N-acetyltransferase